MPASSISPCRPCKQTFKATVNEARWVAIAYLLAASSMMAWHGSSNAVGAIVSTSCSKAAALLDAIESSLVVLVVFAVAVALLSLLRPQRQS